MVVSGLQCCMSRSLVMYALLCISRAGPATAVCKQVFMESQGGQTLYCNVAIKGMSTEHCMRTDAAWREAGALSA